MDTGSVSRGQSGRGVALIAHPSSAEVKERVELYLYPPPSGMAYSSENFTFAFTHTEFHESATNSSVAGTASQTDMLCTSGTLALLRGYGTVCAQ